jgi:hypothetical protein
MRQIAGWLGHTAARTGELYAHQHPDYQNEALRVRKRRQGTNQ